MQDRSLAFYPVIMEKRDTQCFPCFPLHPDYHFCFYTPDRHADWCRLVHEVGPVESEEAAAEIFAQEFLPYPQELAQKCLFVMDKNGTAVATASIWRGEHFGQTLQRLHWVMVSEAAQGKGLCKAMLTKLMQVYDALGYSGYLYLTSETWSYKALGIYRKFGFTPYFGDDVVNWPAYRSEDAHAAWQIVEEKLQARG